MWTGSRIILLLGVAGLLAATFPLMAQANLAAVQPTQDLTELSLAELMEIEVYTDSKQDQPISRSRAVMSVITEAEIRSSGARTLYEVLKRVPGFFPSSQATWTLTASRGLTADSNDHILLLIDGHPQNSIVGQGYQQQDMLPVLAKVKKIEIIRGPGSVLWGSSALLGIINVITKDDLGPDGERVELAYGDGDGMFSATYLNSMTSDKWDGSGIVSVSYWQSRGYDNPDKSASGDAWDAEAAAGLHANVEFPWGIATDWPALDRHKEGWEIYARIRLGDDEIIGRLAESRVTYPWDTWLNNPGSDLSMRKAYVSYRLHDEFSDRIALDTVLYGDFLLQNRFPNYEEIFTSGPGEGRAKMQDQSNEERTFSAETIAGFELSPNNQLKLGAKASRTRIGPNRDARFDIATNTPASLEYPHIGVQSGYDNVLAVFFEDDWDVNEGATTLFFGCRVDYNDFREDKTIVLPRAGVIHDLSDELTSKYIYNSGYMRPYAVASHTTGLIVDELRGPNQGFLLVDKSEEIDNHELQLYWRRGKNYLSANCFYMIIQNYISFDANNVPQGYKNLGAATSFGAELEGKFAMRRDADLYFNYSYALAKLEATAHQGALTNSEDETLNYPRHILNLGCDWRVRPHNVLNVNIGVWRNMQIVRPLNAEGTAGDFGELEGEVYADLNYRSEEIFGSGLDLSLFCMNLFDNTEDVGLIVNNGVWHPRGRNLGVSLNWSW